MRKNREKVFMCEMQILCGELTIMGSQFHSEAGKCEVIFISLPEIRRNNLCLIPGSYQYKADENKKSSMLVIDV